MLVAEHRAGRGASGRTGRPPGPRRAPGRRLFVLREVAQAVGGDAVARRQRGGDAVAVGNGVGNVAAADVQRLHIQQLPDLGRWRWWGRRIDGWRAAATAAAGAQQHQGARQGCSARRWMGSSSAFWQGGTQEAQQAAGGPGVQLGALYCAAGLARSF